MLRRYNFQEKVLFLKQGEIIYYVTITGMVFRSENYEMTRVEEYVANGEIFLKLNPGFGDIRLANVINFAFKGNLHFAFDELMKRSVIYIDGNRGNLDPENLIWSNENATEDKDGFRIIPGYSRYKINEQGIVINYVRDTVQCSYVDKYGYTFFGMTPDCGKRLPVGLHRLMALSYLPIPPNFHEMDVNHLDGIKSNNDRSNLEWCTRTENNLHAVRIGLRSDNKVVLVRNVKTDEVVEFFSLAEAKRVLNLGKMVAETRVKSKGQKTYRDFTQFCLKDDFTKWGDIDLEKDLFISGTCQKVKVTNRLDNSVIVYSSLNEAAIAFGVSNSLMSLRLRRKPPVWEDENYFIEKII